jgi:hypothetical protein
MEEVYEACSGSDFPPDHIFPLGPPSKGYARWAVRLASEYKLEFGIPTRTVANRMVVREVLYKRLHKRNTRHAHIRCVLPLAIELVFLKDESDLELDRLMRQPEMVKRAQDSVKPYWRGQTWASWAAERLLPRSLHAALETAYPGTFQRVPGFTE